MSGTDRNETVRYLCHIADVCSKLHKGFHDNSGKSSLFMVTDCRGKMFTGINVTGSVSEKSTQEEESPLIR